MATSFIIPCGVLLMINLVLVIAQNDPCTICPNGDPITIPDKALSIQYNEFSIDSCGALDLVIGLVFQSGADECALIQSASSFWLSHSEGRAIYAERTRSYNSLIGRSLTSSTLML
jgi:hypothetical protein